MRTSTENMMVFPPIGTPQHSVLARLPAALPVGYFPKDIDARAVAQPFVDHLAALEPDQFLDDVVWRDTFALTGTLRTFYSKVTVFSVLTKLLNSHAAGNFVLVPGSWRIIQIGSSAWVDAIYKFETKATDTLPTSCSLYLSLVFGDDGEWRIWVIKSILEGFQGQDDVDKLQPRLEENSHNINNDSEEFDVVVVGGSQAGLSLGGHFHALKLSYIVLEKNEKVGDAWRLRYDSAKLHTIKEYSYLPFGRTFGPEFGQFLTKDEVAQGHRQWAEKYGINISLSTSLESGIWNDESSTWLLSISREGKVGTFRAKHLIIATGAGSRVPYMPKMQNKKQFKGVVLHSVDYKSSGTWKGKAGIVVGAATTGHDVADDMVQAGMSSVTMVQKSPVYVVPVEYLTKTWTTRYNETIPTELSDRALLSSPMAISRLLTARSFHSMAMAEPERYQALKDVGFKVNVYGDMQYHLNERFGGHYVDIGTSAKITNGLIKIKSNSLPVRYSEDGLIFSDGTEIKANVIVFTTGFSRNMQDDVAQLLGDEVAGRAGKFFGLDDEGEIHGAFKPTGQKGLWYHGGSIGQARYFSRFIALQIKAAIIGFPLPIYDEKHSINYI